MNPLSPDLRWREPATERSWLRHLDPSDCAILRLLTRGASDDAISALTGIPATTVRARVRRLARVSGSSTRVQVAAQAARGGLVGHVVQVRRPPGAVGPVPDRATRSAGRDLGLVALRRVAEQHPEVAAALPLARLRLEYLTWLV